MEKEVRKRTGRFRNPKPREEEFPMASRGERGTREAQTYKGKTERKERRVQSLKGNREQS